VRSTACSNSSPRPGAAGRADLSFSAPTPMSVTSRRRFLFRRHLDQVQQLFSSWNRAPHPRTRRSRLGRGLVEQQPGRSQALAFRT
jgi:hypothetical protein